MTAMMATTATTNHAIAATTRMMTLNRIHAAMARTTAAMTRAPNEGPDFSVFSMNQMYSRVSGSSAVLSRSCGGGGGVPGGGGRGLGVAGGRADSGAPSAR